MPKFWRYLIFQYGKIFTLSVCCFILILLVSRFKDVARFASLTADWAKSGLFMAYQIPAILPLAAPISALIASFLLVQRLSRNHELTALRSSGIGLGRLFVPLCLVSLFISVFHFALCAEITPYCRREAKALLYRETSANPFLLLQRQKLVKIPNIFLRMKVKDEGKAAHDFLMIGYNEAYKKISLISARKLHLEGESLIAEDAALISPIHQEGKEALLIENQTTLATDTPLITAALRKNRPSLDATTLSLKMLRIRSQEWGKSARSARVEILRRLSLSLSLFSFTLLGFSFGIEMGRSPSKKGMFQAIAIALAVLIFYLLGRTLKQDYFFSMSAYLLPHPLIWAYCLFHLRKISRGLG